MAETLTTLIAQPFSLAAAYTALVTDSGAGSPRTVTFNPTGTVWYRTYCAPTGAAGTGHTVPIEFLAYCDGIIGGVPNLWSLALNSAGKVVITYTGTGTGTVAWSGALIAARLGFTGNISCGAGLSQTATNQPMYCLFSHWREAPMSWQGQQVGAAISETDDGRVDFLGGLYSKLTRAFSLRGHPYTPTDQTALSMIATPMYPNEIQAAAGGVWQAPTLTPTTTEPWSIHQFLHTSKGKELGYTFEFDAMIAGTQTRFSEGYWTRKTLESKALITQAHYEALNDATELEVTRTDFLART